MHLEKNKFARLFFGRSFGMTILFRDLLTFKGQLKGNGEDSFTSFFLLNRELVKLYHEQLYIVMWLEQLQLIHEMVVFWVPSFNVSVDSWISETFSWTIQFNIVMMWTNTIDSWHGCVLRFFNVAIPGPPWEAHCFQKSQKHTTK